VFAPPHLDLARRLVLEVLESGPLGPKRLFLAVRERATAQGTDLPVSTARSAMLDLLSLGGLTLGEQHDLSLNTQVPPEHPDVV